jgi:hypothetical protein
MKRGYKFLLWTGALSVLLAVFALYTQPQFLITLSNQIWACF